MCRKWRTANARAVSLGAFIFDIIADVNVEPSAWPSGAGCRVTQSRVPLVEYRRLGSSGLKVSVLSFGSYVTFDAQLDTNLSADCMGAAWTQV